MSKEHFDTPILFIIFNRPDVTFRVFESIRAIRPKTLFVAADGPRNGRPEDHALCARAREVVAKVDWPCEVKTLFQKENLGCGPGPVAAIDWFFEHVPEGIILEDDCLPDRSFFLFCEEMLARYRDNRTIMHISGDTFQYGARRGWASYYFSGLTHNWGWATWRRAWKYNDPTLLPEAERAHIWDAQWNRSVIRNGGLAILPNNNLVSNIGFNGEATHTKKVERYSNLPLESISFPLTHPRMIVRHWLADLFTYRHHFGMTKKDIFLRIVRNVVPRKARQIIGAFLGSIKRTKARRERRSLFEKYRTFTMIPPDIFRANLKLVKEFSMVPGCVVECGVWRGGMIAAMAELLGDERIYYLFDSFEGLPPAKDIDGKAALAYQSDVDSPFYFDNCTAEVAFSKEAMRLSGVHRFEIVEGWFERTLPFFVPAQPIAILRLDSDWYESTMQCLDALYGYVVSGGILIIDDYYTWEGCAKAVHDYLSKNELPDRVYRSPEGICYIIKH